MNGHPDPKEIDASTRCRVVDGEGLESLIACSSDLRGRLNAFIARALVPHAIGPSRRTIVADAALLGEPGYQAISRFNDFLESAPHAFVSGGP
ncbi:MAG: hypothetical protein NTW96_27200, partial [Planctomycetia bacterium]|nr:hypothetical protein [Planctomycetia bacterium]